MSRRGNCWDNAVTETFFSSLKKEGIQKRIHKTRALARADIFDYIETFYNRTSRHSHLDGIVKGRIEKLAFYTQMGIFDLWCGNYLLRATGPCIGSDRPSRNFLNSPTR